MFLYDKLFKPSKTKVHPRLADYEVHVVASCIKKFLRSLKEPIIPLSLLQVFVDAACNPNTTDPEAAMYQVYDKNMISLFASIRSTICLIGL